MYGGDKMMNMPNTGKFLKQYFVIFSDGAELHAWIFLTEECRLIYGHNFKSPEGDNELYVSANERDFFELPDLDKKVVAYLGAIAIQAKATMKIVEFSPEASLTNQLEAMEEVGINTDSVLGFKKRNEEIKMLDRLWNKSEENMDKDCSSLDWLMECVHKWEEANKEKGRFVEFFGSFFSVDPENDFKVKEDKVFVFGLKKTILNTLKEISSEIKKDKEDFINW
jgi:hypothetical protein